MQPPPYYNQPTNNYQGPQVPPPKRNWILRHPIWSIIIAILLLSVVYGIATGNHVDKTTTTVEASASPPPTIAPTQHVATWTTTQTFTGQTHDKTPYFTIKSGWRIKWKCTNSTVPSGATGAVGITAYDHAGNTLSGNADDPTVATGHCPPTFFGTTGTSAVQKYGGTMYLDVYITGDWTIDIQQLQ